jgi:hypothetical protein
VFVQACASTTAGAATSAMPTTNERTMERDIGEIS